MARVNSDSDMDGLVGQLDEWFVSRGKRLAIAESCTGGLISAAITARPGVSRFFQGAVVSYAGSVKEQILSVPKSLIKAMGEVSRPVALEMARGVRSALKSDWAVSVTGIAGPGGGTKEKPVGTVCFAVCGPGFEVSEQKLFKAGTRKEIQQESVRFALELLWKSLHS